MSWEGAAKWVVGINGKKDDSSSHRPGIVDVTKNTTRKRGATRGLPRRYRRRHEKYDTKKRCNTRTSREVTHPSTTLAQARLTAEFDGIRCISAWYDRTRQVLRDQWLYGFDKTHD
ncbi:unnamed protein product [Sphenostylis stenocarpa]|uniref:Uncharacterized protein n=1 Tax=Sphenostylis stenocarpa TaxID=92480 RepID=A0AA86V5Y8_9FABA|nr:unnamed protein product [Sphenostylis stenocarpa]